MTRYCIKEIFDTWVTPTVRGDERVIKWTFFYNDGSIEELIQRELVG